MSKQNQYMSNCVSRILKSEIGNKSWKRVCDEIADCFDMADALGIATAHTEIQKLAKDCENGKFK